MLELDLLASDIHCPAAPGGQVDGADWNLRGEPKRVGCRRTIRNDHLATLMCDCLDRLFDRRRPAPEPTLDGLQVDTTASPGQFSTLMKARQSLVNGSPVPEMKKALCGQRCSLRQLLRVAKDLGCQSLHGVSPVRNIGKFLTLCNGAGSCNFR
jgi:hypothetical protein